MLHKSCYYLGVGLLALAVSQCSCKAESIYDTIEFELTWKRNEQELQISELALSQAKGLTCYVPAEDAVYFLNHDGKGWMFTQTPEGLDYTAISDLGAFDIDNAFVFAAGSEEEQALYFGQVSGDVIALKKCTAGAWQDAGQVQIENLFPGYTWGSKTATADKSYVVSCTFRADDQLKGCLTLQLSNSSTHEHKIGLLVFDPSTQSFTTPTLLASQAGQGFTTAVEVEQPGTIAVGKKVANGSDSFSILPIKSNSNATPVPARAKDSFNRWFSCSLRLQGSFPTAVPIFFVSQSGEDIENAYRLDDKNIIVPIGKLPEELKESKFPLILPFGKEGEVYLVTENSEGESIVFRGTLKRLTGKAKKP